MKMVFPRSTKVNNTSPEKIFQNLIHPLSLAICLRMISCAQIQFGAQSILKCFPEFTGENRISIAYNTGWYTMKFNYFSHVYLGQTRSSTSGLEWNKMSGFRQSIDNHPMLSLPFLFLGSPSIKSIEICSHFQPGISSGWSKPTVFL